MEGAVCDASPLVILAKADLIHILHSQFITIHVPLSVIQEIEMGPSGDPCKETFRTLPWIQAAPPIAGGLSPLMGRLGMGEMEVLRVARANPQLTAILDDKAARRVASIWGIKTVGTLGLLFRQAKMDRSFSLVHALERVRHAGLYLDRKFIEQVLKATDPET